MKTILIATDGSPSARQAIELGLELAEEEEAQPIFVHVAPTKEVLPVAGIGMAPVSVPHELVEADRASLDEAVRIAGERGLDATTKLLTGNPAHEIVAVRRRGRRRPDRGRLARLRSHRGRTARQRLAWHPPRNDSSGADRARGPSAGRGGRVKAISATDGVEEGRTIADVFERVVCGIDGSPQSLEALRQVERLRPANGRASPRGRRRAQPRRPRRLRRAEHLRPARDRRGERARPAGEHSTATSSRLVEGDPASASCVRKIDARAATAVALGSHHHSRACRHPPRGNRDDPAPRGTVLRVCLRGRPHLLHDFPSSIIVGVDGSTAVLRAYDVARELGERLGRARARARGDGRQARRLRRARRGSRLSSGTSESRSTRSSTPRARPTSSSSGAVAFTA